MLYVLQGRFGSAAQIWKWKCVRCFVAISDVLQDHPFVASVCQLNEVVLLFIWGEGFFCIEDSTCAYVCGVGRQKGK
jgi:hypothetical protein